MECAQKKPTCQCQTEQNMFSVEICYTQITQHSPKLRDAIFDYAIFSSWVSAELGLSVYHRVSSMDSKLIGCSYATGHRLNHSAEQLTKIKASRCSKRPFLPSLQEGFHSSRYGMAFIRCELHILSLIKIITHIMST